MFKWEDLKTANETIRTTDIKGKEYAEVNQRIKAFRMVCPNGGIHTEMLSNENGMCVFRATVLDDEQKILGTGTAYEKESSSYINKTSYIENCETSAVGRALGMCGFGIDTSVASAEEVANAIHNQEKGKSSETAKKTGEITVEMLGELFLLADRTRTDRDKIMEAYGVSNGYELTKKQYNNAIKTLKAKEMSMLENQLKDMLEPEGESQ